MKMRLSDIFLDIKLRIAISGFCPSAFRLRRGQATVEYLLMLAVVAGMASIMAVLFHRRILGGLFTLVGLIIGSGKPT